MDKIINDAFIYAPYAECIVCRMFFPQSYNLCKDKLEVKMHNISVADICYS